MENNSAVVFCRVSTGRQGEGFSLGEQERLCDEYACRKGLAVDPEKFILTESGWRKERQGFNAMLAYLQANRITNLLTLNEERLCRDFRSYVSLNDLVDQGLKIHFVETGQIIDGSDPDKMFIWQIKVAMAWKYIKDLKAKVARGFAGKFAKGEYLTCPPLGYAMKKGKLQKDQARCQFIPIAFELYATGNYSLRSLRDELHNRGFRTRTDRMVTIPTLHSILKNDLYIGVLKRKGETRRGVHEPLVDQVLFTKVQAVLNSNRHTYPMKDKWYPYRGFMFCAACGRKLTAEEQKGHIYYHCASRCVKPYLRQEQLEAVFAKALRGFHFDEDLVKWAEKIIVSALAEGEQNHDARRHALQNEYNKNQTALRRIIDDRAYGRFKLELLEEKHKALQERQVKIELELARTEAASGASVKDILSLMDLLRNLSDTFVRADAEHKHKILRFVLEKVVVGKRGMKFHWSPSFRYFYNLKTDKEWLGSKDSNLDCMIRSHESCLTSWPLMD